jgi:hydroxymethylbilane synthase
VIRLGTRGSPLALCQARLVAERLTRAGAEVSIVPMRTEGDRRLDAQLATVGGKGLFVREIEEALLGGAIDVAVHSLKDLPAELPARLCLAAYPEREDPRDVLVTREGGGLEDLPAGARVGTSSPRRGAIARSLRPDLAVIPVRGNVDTRLRKLAAEELDALILAVAGLRRLGLWPAHPRLLDADVFVPAVGQGILGIEARRDDAGTLALVEALDDRATRSRALAERACLARLGASCATPLAAHATLTDAGLSLTALVASEDGRRVLRARATGPADAAERLGREVAESLLADGAASIVPLAPALAGADRGVTHGG